ncbi:MAG: tRNA epoxyqueuosine(34) reductase QueG [Cyanobacteria bacterium J083]|nr:MAG: tRNA epoxyqueuosine(34) reductase QueG [Cyanobacteria bacterium J083]
MVIERSSIIQQAKKLGFSLIGFAQVGTSAEQQAVDRLQAWLKQGYHADMTWMENPKRGNISSIMPEAKSVISLALNYYTPHQHDHSQPETGKISRYAWGRDYHKIMNKKLKALSNWLQNQDKNVKTRYYADTGPMQDKFWAQQAGLGWIGKNGNLLTRDYGSWVFLGEIITNLALTPDSPHTQHCGTCTRCLEACPTQAITQPFVVDANRCLAYHTIENRRPNLPDNIKSNLQGWVAGCDICQDVCPWNQRFAQPTQISDFNPYPGNLAPNLTELAQISPAEWDKKFKASALRRIKPAMWQRNARAILES